MNVGRNTSDAFGSRRQTIEWCGLILIFFLVGTLGRDVWKGPETYVFGPIYHFYTTHTWLVPVNAGTPFLEKPPLYYWTGVIFAKLLGGVLPLHEAARIATLFCMLVTTSFMWMTARLLFAQRAERDALAWMSMTLLLGCITLVKDAHLMEPDIALLAGATVMLYGMARLVCQSDHWAAAGSFIGVGVGISFLAKGLIVPGVFSMAGIALWILFPTLKNRKTLYVIALALAIASPFLVIWPTLLYRESPEFFREWFWENNVGRFLGFTVSGLGADTAQLMIGTGSLGTGSLRAAFPAFPLALLALFSGRREWREPSFLLPASISLLGVAVLEASATARPYYLLPLMPVFALLAAPGLYRLPGRFLAAWNTLLRLLVSLALALIWLQWWNLQHPPQLRPLPMLDQIFGRYLSIGELPGDRTIACLIAALLTAFWLSSFRLQARSPLHTALVWFTAAAVIWGTSTTLLLPWIQEYRSYRPAFMQMIEAAKASGGKNTCIHAFYSEQVSPIFQYVAEGQLPAQHGLGEGCPFTFVMTCHDVPLTGTPYGSLVWRDARLFAPCQEFRLFKTAR